MRTPELDPVSLEILWNRLINIADEGWLTVWRTSFSMIVGDAQDHGFELFDATGASLAHGHRSMPLFNFTLERTVREMLARFPTATLADGDVLITNDPWIASGHLTDVTLVSPVFRAGTLVALVASVAHCTDIGGTRDPFSARDVYDEGVQIPPLKLYRAGEPNADVLDMIRGNVRAASMVLGDIDAMLSANRVGAARLLELMSEYGLQTLEPLSAAIQERSEATMRRAIAAVLDGDYGSEIEIELPSGVARLPCVVRVRGDAVEVDWEGAPPQEPLGGVNCTYGYTGGHTAYALKCLLTPELPSNAGTYRPISMRAPERSVLNCSYPAPVRIRTMVGWYCAPAIFAALAAALPDRAQAFTGMPSGIYAYGGAGGTAFADLMFQGGGQGAGCRADGKSALIFPSAAANTSVEMFEARGPLLVERKELVPDSGGPGEHRGGLGQRLTLRRRPGEEDPALLHVHPQGVEVATPGLFGGLAGGTADVWLEDGQRRVDRESLRGMAELTTDAQRLTMVLGGGSGYGSPERRPLDAVRRDLEDGLVTVDGLAAYGCALNGDGELVRMPTTAAGSAPRG